MRGIRAFVLASASIVSLATPAFAQDTVAKDADEVGMDSEIVVAARRRDESIQDVPLTVNAVSSEAIQKLNIRELKDITTVVPGLVLNPGNRTTGSVSSLRGLNVDVNSSGNNGTVEFYLNDSPISAGAVLQSLYDIGQVEVLRGPQGTLRGRASPSGSITITTKRPVMDEWGGYVQGTATSIGGINANGAINAPLVQDVLAVRIAGLVEDNESNRVRSINNPSLDPSSKTRSVRASARFTPVSNFEVNASYTHLQRDFITFDQVESAGLATGAPVVGRLITAKDRLAVENVANDGHQAFDIFNWQADWSFSGQRLVYVGSYVKQDFRSTEPTDKGDFFDSRSPGDASLPNNNGTYTSPASTLNLQNAAQASHTYTSQESHELRLQSEERLFGLFDYVVGGLITKLVPWTDLVRVDSLVPANALLPNGRVVTGVTNRRGRSIERAVFGNLTLHLGEKAEISGGIRHINYKENTNNSSLAVPQGPDNTYKATIWNASAKYKFTEDLMAYATAGSSFRVGAGTNGLILNSSSPAILAGNTFDPFLASLLPNTPERSKSYEIGVRSAWLDRKLMVNISAFHQDFDGYIFPVSPFYYLGNPTGANPVPVVDGSVGITRSNIATSVPAKIDGVEFEISARPIDNLSLNLTAAYAKSKIDASLPCVFTSVPTAATINQGVTNQQVRLCPVNQSASRLAPFSATAQGEYTHPITDEFGGFVRGLLQFYGNSGNDPQNPYDDVDSYALLNLYAGVRSEDGSWEISAYAKNITNTFRVTQRDASAATVRVGATTTASNYRLISATDPREFGITARYAFGSR